MATENAVFEALKKFAADVTAKSTALTTGGPEYQLRAPFDNFMREVGQALSITIVATDETKLKERLGTPDFAVHASGPLVGYVELKAPGTGANPTNFKDRNKEQWERFKAIPNLIYSDGNEWGLYHSGESGRPMIRLSGDVAAEGQKAVTSKDAEAVLALIREFLSWQPNIPTLVGKGRGQRKIDLKGLAEMLAPLCKLLRDDVTEALKDTQSPLLLLVKDWRHLLFPNAGDEQFADAYAQTVTFALLLAQSEGANPLDLDTAEKALAAEHSLLARALQMLTDKNAKAEILASLNLLLRVIGAVPPGALKSPKNRWLFRYKDSLPFAALEDPWLFFYENFLAKYDNNLRKDAGAYYTPVEVALAQVRLIDDLLTKKLKKPLGFADSTVTTLDPATGTGTYLLAVIDYALARVRMDQGKGALEGKAKALAKNIYGFEIMAGPFAVSELRITRTLQDWGAKLPKDGTHVYLTDTLESPNATPVQMGLWYKEIAEQHKRALNVKAQLPVIVCLGNPPYDRHAASVETNKAQTGGWVRWGEDGKGTNAIFKDFLDPAIVAGHSVRVHNLYNLYVYFWRWALWKVFEGKESAGPGVVSFISASSYLEGDAFCGMREQMRRLCDEIWIIDLGGEGRGTRKSKNVFAIQTPVAIAIAVRYGKSSKSKPATVHYAPLVDGTRSEKLKSLNEIINFASLQWEECHDDWQAPFRPAGKGDYFEWPKVTDIFPWQQCGVKAGRKWVIDPNKETLENRWRKLCNAEKDNRGKLFRDSPTGHKATDSPEQLPPIGGKLKPIVELPKNEPPPDIGWYAYRSFDRQYMIVDARMLDRSAPALWFVRGECQTYLTSLFSYALGNGPAVTASTNIPDLDHFRGSAGAKAVMPLYRDAMGEDANILPGTLEKLSKVCGRKVTPEDFLAYVYGVLAQPAFTCRYAEELGTRELRVPITKNAALFAQVRDVGARLLWLQTYAQRFVPKGKCQGQVPRGSTRCVKAVPGDEENYPKDFEYIESTKTLRVGVGEFSPVAPEVFAFEVSGLKVVQSWLGYRMKKPKGKKSSPLDAITTTEWPSQFTDELLDLLWVLEATLAEYPAQAKLLAAVVKGPCFKADELPPVPDAARKPPARASKGGLFDESEETS